MCKLIEPVQIKEFFNYLKKLKTVIIWITFSVKWKDFNIKWQKLETESRQKRLLLGGEITNTSQ